MTFTTEVAVAAKVCGACELNFLPAHKLVVRGSVCSCNFQVHVHVWLSNVSHHTVKDVWSL